jgi:hypothetical protein
LAENKGILATFATLVAVAGGLVTLYDHFHVKAEDLPDVRVTGVESKTLPSKHSPYLTGPSDDPWRLRNYADYYLVLRLKNIGKRDAVEVDSQMGTDVTRIERIAVLQPGEAGTVEFYLGKWALVVLSPSPTGERYRGAVVWKDRSTGKQGRTPWCYERSKDNDPFEPCRFGPQ